VRREKKERGKKKNPEENHMWNCAQDSYVGSVLIMTTNTLALCCTVVLWLMLL